MTNLTGRPPRLRFRPTVIALLAVSNPVIWVAGHALGRILKAAR
jgi:hypothetical protein